MLFRTPDLDSHEREVLDKIEEVKSSLGYLGQTPKRWYGLLRRVTFARAVRGSNSIEGIHITVEDAIAAAEDEEPLEASEEAWAAVRGYQQAMTYVLHLADDPHFGFSCDLIRSLHYMMMHYDLTKHPGRWRPGLIFVRDEEKEEVVYEGPLAEEVPSLMEGLADSLERPEEETPGIVRAAMAHLNLVMIHPFSDGNGRMARCLQTLVLARTGLLAPPFSSIEEYLGRNTRTYYDVLSEVGGGHWQPMRDPRPWIRFCLTAHYRQATTLLRRSRLLQRLWDHLEEELLRRKLPERMVLALADAAIGLRVRNATYRSIAEVSNNLASRDLRSLVDEGFLRARGEKRGRYYVAAPWLRELRERLAEPKKVADPFEEGGEPPPVIPGLEAYARS